MLKRVQRAGLVPAIVVSLVLAASFVIPASANRSTVADPCGYPNPSPGVPTVTNVSPGSGPTAGGTTVTITGTDFCLVSDVNFGGTPAASFTVDSRTSITAVSPAHAAAVVDVTVTTEMGTSPSSSGDLFTFTEATVFNPIQPERLLDTRVNGARLGPGGDYVLRIGGISVPANATAVVLNVTATETSSSGALIVYPTGAARPTASNLNWTAGETVPNLVSVALGTNGQITIHNIQGSVDVVVDLEGWYAPVISGTAGEFVALPPSRITDTRAGSGQPNAGSTLAQQTTLDVQVTGAGGVPATGAAAVVLNVTVTNPSTSGALTIWPKGASRPLASNLNWIAGKTVPNRVVVALGTGGMVSIYNYEGSVDVVVDVNGYFTDSTASGAFFFALAPSRILDTRNGNGGFSTPQGANSTRVVTVASRGGVPASGVTAAVINTTVTDTTASSALIVWPDLVAKPLASDLNWVAGMTVPNLVYVQLGTNGNIDFYNYVGSVDVVMDVEGYFALAT